MKNTFRTRAFRAGGYSVAAIAIVVILAVAVNILVGALPARWTTLDTSPQKLYTLSDQTKTLTDSLPEKVELHWIVRSGYEDEMLGQLLEQYEGASQKLSLSKLDPDVNPTFLTGYGITKTEDNTVLVVCGERYRYVSADEIYEYDYSNYYNTGTYDVSFAGEGAVTSAISYVVSEDLPTVYLLTGHGESELSAGFTEALSGDNVDTASLNLLTVESVPEEADAVLIYAPQSDLTEEETEKLRTYVENGGGLYFVSGPMEKTRLPHLEALMGGYGITADRGIVIEGDQSHYAAGYPYYLLPNIGSHEITSGVQSSGYYVFLPLARGLHTDSPDGVTVTSLLTTSDSAFSKESGFSMETFEKESGDLDGPFSLAAAAETESGGHVIWVSSVFLLDDQVNIQVSGGNQDFFISGINWMCGHEEGVSIHAKSLGYEYLTMTSLTAASLTLAVVVVIPAVFLLVGIVKVIRRRRK